MAGATDAKRNPVEPRGRILVVDDDEPLTETYAAWLSDRYDVRVANSGAEALERLDETVDVVLLDRRMPDMTGDDVLAEIRERGLGCRVSMLTAVKPDSDIVEMPFEDYLVKPVGREEVLGSVERLLLYDDLDADAEEVLAMNATWEALSDREKGNLRDPEAVDSLRERLESAREDEAVREKVAAFERVRQATSALRGANRALNAAETREEIEDSVAEELVASGAYDAVLVGDYPRTGGALQERVRRHAGDAPEEEPLALDVSGPLETALETGDVTTAALDAGDPLLAPVGDAAHAVAVVPLSYRDTTYGAILVYADAPEITGREADILAELGDRVGTELNDAENRRLMFADATVELTLETTDRSDPVVDLSAALDCTVTLRGFVPLGGEGTNCYLAVEGAEPESVSAHLAEADGVTRYRGISGGDTPLFEVTVGEGSFVHAAPGVSANVVELEAESGRATLVVEVASGGNVRRVVETLQKRFPETEFRGKQTSEGNVQPTGGFRSELDEVLTDRQRTVVETAYEAGYYDFPRSSDGEDVAEALSISAATFHQHLRRATEKLVGAYLSETDPVEPEE